VGSVTSVVDETALATLDKSVTKSSGVSNGLVSNFIIFSSDILLTSTADGTALLAETSVTSV